MIRAYDDYGNVVDMVEHDKQIRAEVIAEAKKKIAFEEKWLIRAINEDKGHYLYNIDIAFNGIYYSLEQLKERNKCMI